LLCRWLLSEPGRNLPFHPMTSKRRTYILKGFCGDCGQVVTLGRELAHRIRVSNALLYARPGSPPGPRLVSISTCRRKMCSALNFPPGSSVQRNIGAHARACKPNCASPVADINFACKQKHAILPVDGARPELGAPHGEDRHRCGDTNLFVAHLLEFASGEA